MPSANETQRIAVGLIEVVDASGNTLLVVDGPNRKVQLPSGTSLEAAGLDINTTELGYLDGVTAGTVANSKAVVLGSDGKINTIDLTAFKVGGTSVTASAAELNYVDVTTAGVAQATKALVADANKAVDALRTAQLLVGVSGSEVDKTNVAIGVAGAYKIARGETALDGSNPTAVATGLTSVVAFTATLKGTAAPGDSTSVLSADISGATVNVYAWKHTTGGASGNPTLVASTGTESFYWIAIGT